jgi:hypothetical protein
MKCFYRNHSDDIADSQLSIFVLSTEKATHYRL